jgi:hypothetical protein
MEPPCSQRWTSSPRRSNQFMLEDEPHLREHAQGSTAQQEASHGHLISEIFTEQIRVKSSTGHTGSTKHETDDVLGKNEEDQQIALKTLKLDKCNLFKKKVTFSGTRSFSEDGIAPTEDRVKALLKEAEVPTDAKALHSFLCTIL